MEPILTDDQVAAFVGAWRQWDGDPTSLPAVLRKRLAFDMVAPVLLIDSLTVSKLLPKLTRVWAPDGTAHLPPVVQTEIREKVVMGLQTLAEGIRETWRTMHRGGAEEVQGAQWDEEAFRRAADEYLSSRSYTLWAHFDLTQDDRRAEAVDWLARHVRAVYERVHPQ